MGPSIEAFRINQRKNFMTAGNYMWCNISCTFDDLLFFLRGKKCGTRRFLHAHAISQTLHSCGCYHLINFNNSSLHWSLRELQWKRLQQSIICATLIDAFNFKIMENSCLCIAVQCWLVLKLGQTTTSGVILFCCKILSAFLI